MSVAPATALAPERKHRLGLLHRQPPELYETSDQVVVVPHAAAIRVALDEIGLSAMFCVQGVPTVATLVTKRYDRKTVVDLHGVLWNQGLASLLIVIAEDTLRAFSLARTPLEEPGEGLCCTKRGEAEVSLLV
jgi:hypothetical protein